MIVPSSELPDLRFVTREDLPAEVSDHLADATKVVALVGYDDDAEAGEIARLLPYGIDGRGVEEIVFVRTGAPTGRVVEFDADSWPGEDRTFVQDDVDAAIALVLGFAVERGPAGAVVLITGRPELVRTVADKLGAC